MSARIRTALQRADGDAAAANLPDPDGRARAVTLVMGDPQAPCEKVFAVLDEHGLLGDDGRLLPEVALVSIGDHFDYGGEPQVAARDVERSGRLLLAWLAAHAPDQVVLLAGNHDLARVGELAAFDDERFARARADAAQVGDDPEREQAFLNNYPELPSSEVARRDFNGFSVAQREQVTRLLRAGRFRAAYAHDARTLLCHAGVALDDLKAAGAGPAELEDATTIAAFLNDFLARAVQRWSAPAPLALPPLHEPGNARDGEGGGVFYHRPCHPSRAEPGAFSGPYRRRFDPRRLPGGVVQIIGHIRDEKCRSLLGEWAVGREARDGELRHLISDGRQVRYAAGLPADGVVPPAGEARIVFIDGGMNYAPASDYELFELQSGRARRP